MRSQKNGKTRSDRPSGRQASEQPEHAGNEAPSAESLHQGQGPDFVTQDKRMQEKNQGVKQLDKNLGFQQAGLPHQQKFSDTSSQEGGEQKDETGRNRD